MSFIVAIADEVEDEIFIKKFEARSLSECQDKVMNYVINAFEWPDNIDFPVIYNDFVTLMVEYNILISDIKDIELI